MSASSLLGHQRLVQSKGAHARLLGSARTARPHAQRRVLRAYAGSASPEQRVQELGLVLDGRLPTNPQGVYHPVVLVGSLAHVSGQIPRLPDGSLMTGIAGDSASEEQAAQAAYEVGVTMLATLKNELGSLDRVKRIVKVNGYVACTPDFERQPAVMNALSNLFIDVFGPAGKSARSAVGVAALPLGITVEAEAIVEVDLE
ncbi:YjgF_endoribonc domain-containing protein [Pycnococcus provasolii]